MPHATLKLVPGVDTTKTPTLNEMAVSYSNLIRFFPDRSGLGLVQKLGGWDSYIAGGFNYPIRELKAWSDLEYTKYLAIGSESTDGATVYNATDDSTTNVTPYYFVQNEESSYTNTSVALPSVTIYSSVVVATTALLTASYNNGASGVGATLTNTGTFAPLSIDGVSLTSGDRVLVKNQTGLTAQNGIYTVTTVGTVSTAWVLTRATDFDTTAEIQRGASFFVSSGTVNANRYYYCSNASAVTVGTTGIGFVRGGGFTTANGTESITFYTTNVPSSASYAFFPTIVNVGNINLLGPYDILTTGSGFFTFAVPSALTTIAKISSTTSGANRIVTVQFSAPHSFYGGQNIYVANVTDSTFNGSFTISTTAGDVTTYTIKYTQTGVTTATSSNGGTVNARVNFGGEPPLFTTTNQSPVVQVTLTNHGYSVGDTFNIPVSTSVGGITLSGLYTVTKVNSPSIGNYSSSFEITANRNATSSASNWENNGNIYAKYFVSLVPTSQGANYYYGGGVYNEGLYGSGYVPENVVGDPITADDWTFDNWGSVLIGCPKNDAVYYWQPVGSAVQNLGYMPNAPVYNLGAFVAMPQRQVIAYGSSFGTIQDPLLVRWCDLEDFTVWNAQANNQAGSYRIPTGSKIVGGIQASQQALIWTDLDVWSMTYIGQPYIYSFNKVGANAGLISQKAAGQMGGVVYWMGQKQFFRFSGNGVEVIPCPVWDQIFQNLYPGVDENDNPYTDRIRCATNTQFNEVTWYFPAHYINYIDPATSIALSNQTLGTGEVNAYVKYNVALNQWDYGYQDPENSDVLVGRTAWIDQSVLGPPIGAASFASVDAANTTAVVYQHETSNNANNNPLPCGFTTGYASIAEGDQMTFIDQVWPDMKWGQAYQAKNADVDITFYVANYPGDTPVQHGPYTVTRGTEYLSVRMRGRLIAISMSSNDTNSFWRIGAMRYRFQPDGKY